MYSMLTIRLMIYWLNNNPPSPKFELEYLLLLRVRRIYRTTIFSHWKSMLVVITVAAHFEKIILLAKKTQTIAQTQPYER